MADSGSGEKVLAGRHALVTGGGRGIGAAIAEALASRGASVTLLGRNLERVKAKADELASAHGIEAGAVAADVTSKSGVAEAFARARQARGPVDILVNNAGAAKSAPLAKTGEDLWREMLEVNLTGPFLCTQEAVAEMTGRSWGRIVNVASTAGLVGYAYVGAYCAAKHGVIGLTRSLALELAKTGVTVNAVCPGYTDTDLLRDAVANIVGKTGRSEEEAMKHFSSVNPLGRVVRPEEVAETVAWLCLPTSAAVTGQAIAVAGGEVMN